MTTHDCECGAKLEVEPQYLTGHMESEEYYCPECNREYKIRSANTPNVRVINKEELEENKSKNK